MYYSSVYGYPYSAYGYSHFLKKREAPAEDQQADPAMYVNSWYGYNYPSFAYTHLLKKREAPAEDQQADAAAYYRNIYGLSYPTYYSGVHYLKKREADPKKEEEEKKIVFINAMPYASYGFPYAPIASPYIFKK